MIVVSLAFDVGLAAAMLGGWLLYFHERSRSRDYATDLAQCIHDYDLGRDDLRRALGHDEIERYLDD